MIESLHNYFQQSNYHRKQRIEHIMQFDLSLSTYLSTLISKNIFPHQGDEIEDLETLDSSDFLYLRINQPNIGANMHQFIPKEEGNGYYIVHYAGNGQNALDIEFITRCLQESPSATHIFWNYPEVGTRKHSQLSGIDRHDTGYAIQHYLIESLHIDPQKTIIDSWSMGGGVALKVTRRLHQEGHAVSLFMDRPFRGTDPVIQAKLNLYKKEKWITLATSSLYAGSLGAIGGDLISRVIAGVGVATNGAVDGIGYLISQGLSQVASYLENLHPWLNTLLAVPMKYVADFISATFSLVGTLIDNVINIIASAVGAIAIIVGAAAGLVFGATIGSLLSIPQLFGFEPIYIPTTMPVSQFLKLNHLDLDTDKDLRLLTETDTFKADPSRVISINTTNDWLVEPEAGVNTDIESNYKNSGIHSLWFAKGSHGDPLAEPIGEENEGETHQSLLNSLLL